MRTAKVYVRRSRDSVGIAAANGVRLVIVLVGIALCLGGNFGLINPAYQKNALWKR